MIRTEYIKTMEDLKSMVFEQKQNEKNNRLRSSYFYRGVRDDSFDLRTSLQRNCQDLSSTLEPLLLKNFSKYASIEDPSISSSEWKAMIVGQHHGLPTRLLDWTHSSMIALHFATSEDCNQLDKHDCAVWRIDAKAFSEKLPSSYKSVLKKDDTFIFSLKSLESVAPDIKAYDDAMQDKCFIMLEPPSIDQRIVNQYSFFSVMPSRIVDFQSYLEDGNEEKAVKYIIDKSLRWDLRDLLDQQNINERMIYPGLDGISQWLGRHYFVKK